MKNSSLFLLSEKTTIRILRTGVGSFWSIIWLPFHYVKICWLLNPKKTKLSFFIVLSFELVANNICCRKFFCLFVFHQDLVTYCLICLFIFSAKYVNNDKKKVFEWDASLSAFYLFRILQCLIPGGRNLTSTSRLYSGAHKQPRTI